MKNVSSDEQMWRSREHIARIWLPAILCGLTGLVIRHGSLLGWVMAVPLLAAIFTYSSAVRLRRVNNQIEYRRFKKWKAIPDAEVLDAENSVLPGLGVLKMSRSHPPLGRIYFLVEDEQPSSFGKPGIHGPSAGQKWPNAHWAITYSCFAVGGGLLWTLLVPSSISSLQAAAARMQKPWQQVIGLADRPILLCAWALLLLASIMLERKRGFRGCIKALVLGIFVSNALQQWLSG